VLTRADLEAWALRLRDRPGVDADGLPLGSQAPSADSGLHDPAQLLADILSTWPRGGTLVLEGGGRRVSLASAPLERSGAGADFRVERDQVVMQLFTSGTTGRPERHDKTAQQLLGEARVLVPLLQLGTGSTVLSTVPLHHLYGFLFGLLVPMQAGARVVVDVAGDPARFHPHRVAEAIQSFGVTHLVTIPAHIQSLVDARAQLIGLKEVVSSAAPLPVSWAKQLEELSFARVIDILGSTETGGIAWRRTARDERYRPLPGVTVRALEGGELEVQSPFADAERAIKTGDRVRLEPDGTFVHLGRDDGIVKIGGKRLSLRTLEAAALDVSGVTDALAFVNAKGGARSSEVWLVVAAMDCERRDLRAELTRRVEPLLLPRRIRVLRRLPRDTRGKVPQALLKRYVSLPDFDLVDLSCEPFRAELRLRADARRLVGHFPGAPVLPAVAELLDLIVPEVQRQASASVCGARRLKWHAPVLPGQTLVFTVDRAGGDLGRDYKFRLATPEGSAVASGTLMTRAAIKDLR